MLKRKNCYAVDINKLEHYKYSYLDLAIIVDLLPVLSTVN